MTTLWTLRQPNGPDSLSVEVELREDAGRFCAITGGAEVATERTLDAVVAAAPQVFTADPGRDITIQTQLPTCVWAPLLRLPQLPAAPPPDADYASWIAAAGWPDDDDTGFEALNEEYSIPPRDRSWWCNGIPLRMVPDEQGSPRLVPWAAECSPELAFINWWVTGSMAGGYDSITARRIASRLIYIAGAFDDEPVPSVTRMLIGEEADRPDEDIVKMVIRMLLNDRGISQLRGTDEIELRIPESLDEDAVRRILAAIPAKTDQIITDQTATPQSLNRDAAVRDDWVHVVLSRIPMVLAD